MNRTLLVSLLKKNIDELILLTEGFSEMKEYPSAILILAKNKTDDIKSYIDQLGDIHEDQVVATATIDKETPAIDASDVPTYTEESNDHALETSTEEDEPQVIASGEEIIEDEEEDDLIEEDYIDEEEEEDEIIEQEPSVPEKKITIAEKMASQTITRNEWHAKGETTAINDSIAHKKIDDIRQAISLGDRFRFQRELFKNNGEEMNKMLSYINLLASYDEIVSFLQSKYGWAEDHPVANDFYQIIKRKF